MIRPQPFRQPDLGAGEIPLSAFRFPLPLACHKGNASQEQKSTQTGAQTSGVAATGNNNIGNSGNQIVIGATGGGDDGRRFGRERAGSVVPAPASNVTATITNGLTAADATDFVKQLSAAFKTAPSANAKPDSAPPDPAVSKPADPLPLWKKIAIALSAAAGVASIIGVGFLIFNRKKKT